MGEAEGEDFVVVMIWKLCQRAAAWRVRVKSQPKKKADVVEHPEAFDHVGLLANEPPGQAGLLFISSSDDSHSQVFIGAAWHCPPVPSYLSLSRADPQ
jgi:hypothetical protein